MKKFSCWLIRVVTAVCDCCESHLCFNGWVTVQRGLSFKLKIICVCYI